MVPRDINYEMPEIQKGVNPNQAVQAEQLRNIAGLEPVDFAVDIYELLDTPFTQIPSDISFPDPDPITNNTFSTQIYPTTIKNFESAQRRYMQAVVFSPDIPLSTGDGKFYMHIPSKMNSDRLVEVHAEVVTAGTTGTTDIQIHNVTQSADMLSTKLTIDTGETGSDTAATPAVIDTANDDIDEDDVLRIDVDAVSTTPPEGLIVTLGFE